MSWRSERVQRRRDARASHDSVSLDRLDSRFQNISNVTWYTGRLAPMALTAAGLASEAAGANREQRRSASGAFRPGREIQETAGWAKKLGKAVRGVRSTVQAASILARPSVGAAVGYFLHGIADATRDTIIAEIDRRAREQGLDPYLSTEGKLLRLRERGAVDPIGPAPRERAGGGAQIRRIGRKALRVSF